MKALNWGLFASSLFLLCSSAWRRWTYQRRGEALPWQFAGNVTRASFLLGMRASRARILFERLQRNAIFV
jgi:hypothetical protein